VVRDDTSALCSYGHPAFQGCSSAAWPLSATGSSHAMRGAGTELDAKWISSYAPKGNSLSDWFALSLLGILQSRSRTSVSWNRYCDLFNSRDVAVSCSWLMLIGTASSSSHCRIAAETALKYELFYTSAMLIISQLYIIA